MVELGAIGLFVDCKISLIVACHHRGGADCKDLTKFRKN